MRSLKSFSACQRNGGREDTMAGRPCAEESKRARVYAQTSSNVCAEAEDPTWKPSVKWVC